MKPQKGRSDATKKTLPKISIFLFPLRESEPKKATDIVVLGHPKDWDSKNDDIS